jgi:hypothetical protein
MLAAFTVPNKARDRVPTDGDTDSCSVPGRPGPKRLLAAAPSCRLSRHQLRVTLARRAVNARAASPKALRVRCDVFGFTQGQRKREPIVDRPRAQRCRKNNPVFADAITSIA